MNMEKEFLALLALQTVGFGFFRKFESNSPWWRSIVKWIFLLGIVWAVAFFFGHANALYTILGLTILSLVVHFTWCYRNGIHPLMATPRKRYFELRGWRWEE